MERMVSNEVMAANVALLDLHDARLNELTVQKGGGGRIRLERVSVFVPIADETYDVWSCALDLCVTGLRNLALSGLQDADHYISDAEFYDAAGSAVTPDSMLGSSGATRLALTLAGRGGKVEIEFERIDFGSIDAHRKLEQWSGPL